MNPERQQDLERRLAEPAPAAPPAHLLGRLRAEIPAQLPVAPASRRAGWPGPRWAAAAALVFVAAGAGWLLRSRGEIEPVARPVEPPVEALDDRAPAPAAPDAPYPALPGEAAAKQGEGSPDVRPEATAPVRSEASPRALSPAPLETAAAAKGEIPAGVVGGVEGGIPGGVPGGVAAPSEGETSATAREGPLRPEALRSRKESVTARAESPALPAPETRGTRDRSATLARPPVPPSTGGDAEPNDAPVGDMFFRAAGTNPFVDADEDPLSTFGLDVDTGSYTLARRYLYDGNLPDPDGIRVEEFVNSFPPLDGPEERTSSHGDFSLRADGAETPFAAGADHRIVRFTLRARTVAPRERRHAVLTFVVDTSGSMDRENRLELVKRSLGLLLDELDRGDRVGLVIYDDRARVLLEPTGDRAAVRAALASLRPGGSTNAEEGLALGFEVAGRAFERGAVNRVILASDGVANVGATGPESILRRIGESARRGIQLTTVGFGMGNYNDALMEQLADQGNGSYAYVDTLEEARRIFRQNLTGTLETVAYDAKAQVEWNPAVVSRYRLLGYENRDVADRRFRDDSVDAGEIGAGHTVTALYEVRLRDRDELPGGNPRVATLRLRYRHPAERRAVEISEELFLRALAPRWAAAAFDLRRAAVAAQFAELLKGSTWAREDSWDELRREARRLEGEGWRGGEGEGERTRELADLIERARRLVESAPSRREPRPD